MGQKRSSKRVSSIPRPKLEHLPSFSDNNWSVNLRHVATSGDFAWPTEEPQVQELAATLSKMTTLSWDDFRAHKIHSRAGDSHHPRSLRDLRDSARAAAKSHSAFDEIGSDLDSVELFGVRACNAEHAPERIWGVFVESVFFALWWDPRHEFSGSQTWKSPGACASDCLHPLNATTIRR